MAVTIRLPNGREIAIATDDPKLAAATFGDLIPITKENRERLLRDYTWAP